jgi:Fe-S oxidoreductase
MAVFDLAYAAAYAVTVASVLLIFASVASHARRWSVSLAPARVLGLAKDEASRLRSGDPVFLMHLSIALGVGLSIAYALLAPVIAGVPYLRALFLAASVPLLAGLVAALFWRAERYVRSKEVERFQKLPPSFSARSSYLQLVLILAIALTASELAILWFPALAVAGVAVGVARNVLVAAYYARPSVNLVGGFDKPLPAFGTPFKLADVMAGETDPGSVRVGVAKASDFDPAQRLSVDSCVEIGACESACPATAAGRPLSPRVLVRQVSLLAREKGGDADPFAEVTEDELWSCTSCGACVASCPVSVKHLDVIYDLRRGLVAQGKLDKRKATLLENLAQTQNPYGFKNSARGAWAEGAGVDTLAANPRAEYLYWVGCLSSFDQRAQRVAKAMSKILKKAGVSFAILGGEELCVGDPARRLGEEGRYQELAYANIEKLNSYGVRKIVASCPHCFNALKNEYPAFGGRYEVVYHTQLISDLIRDGKIRVPAGRVRQVSATLHDACYASRYNNVFDEPRAALRAAVGDVREMKRRKEKTFCCGAGGSNYWFEVPQQRSIAGIRTEEASKTGAETLATECPFCLSMLDDSTKVAGSPMEVRDVAEIVADSL